MDNNLKNSEIKEIYQVIESYCDCMDGYTPAQERILKTFVDRHKAWKFLNDLVSNNEMKKNALEEAGISGYYNKFEHYIYYMKTFEVEE